jgi:outer membrane protein
MSKTVLALGAAFSLLASAAHAEGWIVSIGGRVSVAAPYEGADHYVMSPSPTLSARRADRPYRFTPGDGGTTFALIDTDHFVFGPMARFRYRRGDEGSLTGLRKVKWAAEPGAFMDIWPVDWLRLHGELRHGVVGHTGLVGDAGADLVVMGDKWDASIGPRFGWGNKTYMDRYFGVTPLEAARSPLIASAYEPGSGRRYTGVAVSSAYHLSDNLQVKLTAGYNKLASKAENSPIVAIAGSSHQYLASAGVSYSFGIGR